MKEIFGNFIEQAELQEYLVIHFSPSSIPLQQRWRNNGLSADFLAEYWATFFPTDDAPSVNRVQEIKGTINYIANELLENVMKFSYQPANLPVKLGLHLYQQYFRFYASNAIDPASIPDFQAWIRRLLTEDPGMLYLSQIERNVANEADHISQLGLLTMLNDYGASLAWKFESDLKNPEIIVVTTMVQWEI